MQKYQRMTYEKRCLIEAHLKVKLCQSEIAKILGVHKSTVSRELRRNSSESYEAVFAQKLYRVRFKSCRKKIKLQGKLLEESLIKIRAGWSPEQVSGRFKLESKTLLSHETIYRYLRRDKKLKGETWKYLRKALKTRGRSRFSRRKSRPDWMKTIRERPREINQRERYGDWERDLMLGQERKALLVCVERKSRYVKIGKVESYRSIEIFDKTTELLRETKTVVHSITNDNGTEFSDGYLYSIPVYYCDPAKPQQRGTVENTIGLLRQYQPKKANFKSITETELKTLEDKINLRPRKCLDYKTPYEVLYNTTVALVS